MRRWFVPVLATAVIVAAALWYLLAGSGAQTVTVYVSHDQVFSEPILNDFEKETGIKVRAVYDTEESRSTGAMNRLIAEKKHPQADVYWANEPIRAEVLRQRGLAAAYVSPNAQGIPRNFKDPNGYWTGFAARARVFIVNKNSGAKPSSVLAYADPQWRGKATIANPLFGTTTTEIAALFVLWGDARAQAFMNDIKNNDVKLSSSNGDSADLVARGEFSFALVDSDDVVSRLRQGQPVELVYPDQSADGIGCFIVPNATLLVAGAPHRTRQEAYRLSPVQETEGKLARSDAAQIPLHAGVQEPAELGPIETMKSMQVNYAAIAAKLHDIQPFLKTWVIR